MMKKKILIASFDMAIGGVERSLIGLLSEFDYSKYDVDLMLFKHEGEFLPLLPKEPNLLPEIAQYTTFRKSIKELLKEGENTSIGIARLIARVVGVSHGKCIRSKEPGYLVIQYGWKTSLPLLPKLEEEYDVAISFLWPHYFIGNKVRAKRKIGWIHTDYLNIKLNKGEEYRMWKAMDHIVAVSESCRDSFLSTLPYIDKSVEVIENIISPEFVREQSNKDVTNEMSIISGRIKLLTVGRLSHAKGIDDAIYACRKLLDQGYNIEWYVVGYGPQEMELKILVEKLGIQDRFFLLGKKINPYPYIKISDIYVQPSRYEGKAVTVREAQILGKPVLITNFPTAKSQVQDGIDGIITSMGIEGIVEGVKRLIEDKELRDGLAVRTAGIEYGNENGIEKLYTLFS
ncbi:glycosyl transferase [Bacillus cereus]|uniref:Glycosyl transferase n=1 Tax=Bacillus cereus TaxID=1396 RepID=A0A2B2HNN7_BACCE|nr:MULTISPECIES: glycosyltransferase [Bacillus cereus group]PFP95344.1 glycosyl transferase [Bacillus cereus]PGO33419.1 glycosyl transferase [Bacillus cereus]UNP79139.1 glycosyltransferase [Bacillus nitratireducens]